MIAGATGFVVALDSLINMFTIWDIIRNQFFYLGPQIAQQFGCGMIFIVGSYVSALPYGCRFLYFFSSG